MEQNKISRKEIISTANSLALFIFENDLHGNINDYYFPGEFISGTNDIKRFKNCGYITCIHDKNEYFMLIDNFNVAINKLQKYFVGRSINPLLCGKIDIKHYIKYRDNVASVSDSDLLSYFRDYFYHVLPKALQQLGIGGFEEPKKK